MSWIEERYKEKTTILPLSLQSKYGKSSVKVIIDCNTMFGEKVSTTNIVGVYPADKDISNIVHSINEQYNQRISDIIKKGA